MNNEINEGTDNNKKETNKNEDKPHFFKINIIKPKEIEKTNEKQNTQNNMRLSLSSKRNKSKKKINDIKLILESSFRPKYSKRKSEQKSEGNNCNNNNENDSIFGRSENSINLNDELNNNNINPKNKININQINNSENNSNKNLYLFTNNLYQNDEHFKKCVISKKNKNDFSKSKINNSLSNIANIKNISNSKKNFKESISLHNQSCKSIKNFLEQNSIKIDSKFKFKEKKYCFENKLKLKNPIKTKDEESFKNYTRTKVFNLNDNNKSNIQYFDENNTVKSSNIYLYKNKIDKIKYNNNEEKKLEINNKKSKPKKNAKTNKKKVGEKKTVSVNNLKNKNNEIVENVKKENCKIQEDIDKKNKKKKFCLFCCFNIK